MGNVAGTMASEDDSFWDALNRTFPEVAASTTDHTGAADPNPLDGLFDDFEPQPERDPQYYGDLMPVASVNDALGRKRVAADNTTDYTKRPRTTPNQPSAGNQELLEMLRSGKRSRAKNTPITKIKSKIVKQAEPPKPQLTQEELENATQWLKKEVDAYIRMAEENYKAKQQKLFNKELPMIIARAQAQGQNVELAKSKYRAKIQSNIKKRPATIEKKKQVVRAVLLKLLKDTEKLYESGNDLDVAENSYAFLQQFFVSNNAYVQDIVATDPIQAAKLALDQKSVGSLV